MHAPFVHAIAQSALSIGSKCDFHSVRRGCIWAPSKVLSRGSGSIEPASLILQHGFEVPVQKLYSILPRKSVPRNGDGSITGQLVAAIYLNFICKIVELRLLTFDQHVRSNHPGAGVQQDSLHCRPTVDIILLLSN